MFSNKIFWIRTRRSRFTYTYSGVFFAPDIACQCSELSAQIKDLAKFDIPVLIAVKFRTAVIAY